MQALSDELVPEIQRVHLAHAVLQLKAAGIDNIVGYPWLEAPPAECCVRALELLYALGAVNEDAKYAFGSMRYFVSVKRWVGVERLLVFVM
jgi:HrpA-like RNA helicase